MTCNRKQIVLSVVHIALQCGLVVWSSSLGHGFTGLVQGYNVGNSVLDVAVSSVLYSLGILLLIPVCSLSFVSINERDRGRLKSWVYWCTMVFHAALMAKAVVVAILCDSDVWPTDSSHSGIACMYASLVGSFVMTQWQQGVCLDDLGQDFCREASSIQEPLINGVVQEEDPKGSDDAQHATIRALLGFAAPDALLLTCGFIAGSLAALGQALIPYYTGKVIDYASIDPDEILFKKTLLKLLLVALFCAVFTGIRGGLFTFATTKQTVRIRLKLFESLLYQDCGFFDTNRTGDITSRLAADTTTVTDQICLNLNIMMRSCTQAGFVLVFMFKSSWRLTVVTFVMVPIVIVVSKIYGSYYRKMSKKVQSKLAEANSVADECLSAISVVKSHAAETSTRANYRQKLEDFYHIQLRQALAYSMYMVNNTFLSAAVVAGVLYYGGTLVLHNAMSAGSLVSFMLYQQSLSAAFQSLGDVFSALSAAVGAADKVIELINRKPEFVETGVEKPDRDLTGDIEFRNISFSYPARPNSMILENFSLKIRPGEIIALVGPSGGGKSSIVKLLERQYLPNSGSILIDGRDIGQYDKKWLKRRMALVGQEPVLFARSIKRNIIYGMEVEDGLLENEVPNQDQIEEASKLANAHEFISLLPEQYDTECGERGVQLSGGQKQRLAIARALIRKPSILLLDEATSALDADSEHVVQEALEHSMVGRTVLVIAHRLSTIQNADRICVVKRGYIVEMGRHEELLEQKGVYEKLVRRQMAMARTESSASLFGKN